MEELAPNTPEGDAAPRMSFFQRLAGIYLEPQKTFEDINRKSGWLGIFIIVCVLAMGANYALTARMDHETMMRKSLAMSPITKNMPEEEIQRIIAQPRSAFTKYLPLLLAPLGVLVSYAVIAGAFLLLFVLMGGALTFKKSYAASIWGMAPPSIIVGLLGILFMFIKDPVDLEINPANNVVSNLGLLVSETEQPVVNSLLSSLDVFSFWAIYLLGLGFSALSNGSMTVKKATTGVLILWAVWVLGKAGYYAIF